MTKTSDESENKAVLVRLTPAMTREQKLKNLVGALEKQGIKIKRSPGAETVKNGDASFFIANDRLYTGSPSFSIKLDHREQVHPVGYCNSRHFFICQATGEPRNPNQTIPYGKFAV